MIDHQFRNFIVTLCNNIYRQLGTGHSESVYQKALQAELNTQGYNIDTEYPISVEYTDSKGRIHSLASERIDVYIHKTADSMFVDIQNSDIILELKATSKNLGCLETEQVKKYLRQFEVKGKNIPYGILINFPQPTSSGVSDDVKSMIIELDKRQPSQPPLQPQSTTSVNKS